MISTERVFRELNEYLEEHKSELKTDEDYERLAKQFLSEYNASIKSGKPREKTAEDYVDMADEAETLQKRVEYLNKALSLDPDSVDAKLGLIKVRMSEEPEEKLVAIASLMDKAAEPLKEKRYFEHYRGEFWGLHETRPFMRVKQSYMDSLIDCGMISLAIEEGNEMIALNTNDNLGIRYTLMHLYALTGDEKAALELHKKYEYSEETQMLLPFSVLYYRLGQFDKAEEYLKKLNVANKDTRKFLRAFVNEDQDAIFGDMDPHGYRPYTIEDLGVAMIENKWLYVSSSHYFHWAYRCLNKKNDRNKPGNITAKKY